MAKNFRTSDILLFIQAAIGSVEMSSRFSVMNFSKDQDTLQNAADALRSYLYVAFMWTLATVLVMYSQYGYYGAFKKAAITNNLGEPNVF